MTRIIKWWQRTKIWGKFRDTCALFGSGTTIGLQVGDVEGFWAYAVPIATLVGTAIGIWFSDDNNDGIADIFQ